MVIFSLGNTYTRIDCSTDEEIEKIDEALTVKHTWFFRGAYKTADRKYFHGSGTSIPTGLLRRVYSLFPPEQVKVYDCRKNDFESLDITYKGFELRKHQAEAVEVCVKRGRGIVHHATGAGKTITFANLIARLGKRALVIVPNKLLLNQAYATLSETLEGVKVGRAGGKYFEIDSDVLVATAAMLYARWDTLSADFFRRFGTLIVDECHHINETALVFGYQGNTWYDLALQIQAQYRFAFSGTVPPDRKLHRFAVEAVSGAVLHRMLPQDCVDAGVISEAEIIMYELPVVEDKTVWPDAREPYIIQRLERNELIRDVAVSQVGEGKSVLIFVDRIAHGRILESMIPNSVFVQGMNTTEERELAIDALSKKDRVVIGTIFGEGFDLPGLDLAINAAGGKATIRLIQQVGRVLRKHEGKNMGTLVDFFDRDIDGVISKHAVFRKRLYEKHFGNVQLIH